MHVLYRVGASGHLPFRLLCSASDCIAYYAAFLTCYRRPVQAAHLYSETS